MSDVWAIRAICNIPSINNVSYIGWSLEATLEKQNGNWCNVSLCFAPSCFKIRNAQFEMAENIVLARGHSALVVSLEKEMLRNF